MDTAAVLAELSLRHPRTHDVRYLGYHQAKMYSQNGEDGIISEIFRRIGDGARFFVEIGVESGLQNNTRLLLEAGWRGVWIEGSADHAAAARASFSNYIDGGLLRVAQEIVTRDNINDILRNEKIPDVIDFLSIDIDYNTGHIWERIDCRSRACCIEYNSSIPAAMDVSVPYDPAGVWQGDTWFGHGLKASERIGAGKGLALVGCEFAGVNAFFVNNNEAKGRFLEPFTAEMHYEAPKYRLGNWSSGHPPSTVARRWIRQA